MLFVNALTFSLEAFICVVLAILWILLGASLDFIWTLPGLYSLETFICVVRLLHSRDFTWGLSGFYLDFTWTLSGLYLDLIWTLSGFLHFRLGDPGSEIAFSLCNLMEGFLVCVVFPIPKTLSGAYLDFIWTLSGLYLDLIWTLRTC